MPLYVCESKNSARRQERIDQNSPQDHVFLYFVIW